MNRNRTQGIAPDKTDPIRLAQPPQKMEAIQKPPFLYPMNREEAQRTNGMRMAILNSSPDQTALRANAANYGVGIPQPKFKPIEQALMDTPGGNQPADGMPVDPNDGGMAANLAMPTPMQPQMPNPAVQQPMQQMDPRQRQGLAQLMARLSARGGGF